MEQKTRDANIFPFRGYASHPASLEYCEDLINMELVGDEFKARRGYTKLSDAGLDAGVSIRGGCVWKRHAGVGFAVCVDSAGGVYKIAAANLFAGDGTWTPMASGMTMATDQFPCFFRADLAASSSPILVMTGLGTAPQQFFFTSSTFALANLTVGTLDVMTNANPYKGCIYGQRVLLWGSANDGYVYYSDTANPFGTYLSNKKAIGNLSETVIDIIPSNRGALIFKENSIWTVTGIDFATASPAFVMNAPVLGRRGVCQDKNGIIYFVNGRSVMRWGSPSENLSKNLEELFETSDSPYNSWLGYIGEKDQLLYLSQDDTRKADAYVFDLAKGALISKANNYPFHFFHALEAQDTLEHPGSIIAGTALTSSRLYWLYNETSQDESSNISSLIQSKYDHFGSPITEKTPRSLFIWGKSASPIYCDLLYRDKDYTELTATLGSSLLPAEIHFSPSQKNTSGNPINFVEASIKLYGQQFTSLKNIGFRFVEQREIFTR